METGPAASPGAASPPPADGRLPGEGRPPSRAAVVPPARTTALRTVVPRYGLVASRWGRAPERRVGAFALLRHAALRARGEDARLLVVDETAAQPWVERAAELFGVPRERLTVEHAADRDAALFDTADRVFALWVRRGGKIA